MTGTIWTLLGFKFAKKKKEQILAVTINGQETAHCLVGGPWGIFTLTDGS